MSPSSSHDARVSCPHAAMRALPFGAVPASKLAAVLRKSRDAAKALELQAELEKGALAHQRAFFTPVAKAT